MKRRVDGYMVYGCNDCGRGFKMYLETGIEGIGDGDNHKPAPFSIQCPFCNGFDCHDVAFQRFNLKQKRNPKNLPFFANFKNHDCGTPINLEFAKPDFFKKKGENQ